MFIQELWAGEAGRIDATMQELVFAGLAGRKYEKILKFGDTVNIGTRGHLTAQTKAKASNTALSFETVTELNTTLTVATWEYSGIAVESIVDKQSMVDQMAMYAPEQGYALNLAVDDVLAGLVDDTTNAVGTLGVSLSYDNLLTGIQNLDDANRRGKRVLVTAPAQFYDWMKLDVFMRSDYVEIHGNADARGLKDGMQGNTRKNWLNIPIYMSTNVEGSNAAGHDNCVMELGGMQLVMQIAPRAHRQKDINYLCDKVVLEQLYGTKLMPIASSITTYEAVVWLKGL